MKVERLAEIGEALERLKNAHDCLIIHKNGNVVAFCGADSSGVCDSPLAAVESVLGILGQSRAHRIAELENQLANLKREQ